MKYLLYTLLFLATCFAATAQVPTSGLQGLYYFDGNAADSSGNGNDLTNLSNPTAINYIAGRNSVGQALSTSGNSLCGSLISPSNMSFTGNEVTISFWGKFDGSSSSGGRSVLTVLNGSNSTASYGVEYRNAGTPFLLFYVYHSTNYSSYTVITSYLQNWLNTWNFFTFTFSPTGGARMYVNGSYVVDVPATATTVNSGSNALRVSHNNSSFCMTQTPLDEVAVYNRALSATEVTDLFYGLYDGPCIDTIVATMPATKNLCQTVDLLLTPTVTKGRYLTYQWYKDNQLLAGETNDTLLRTASASNGGDYTVKIMTGCDTLDLTTTVTNINAANITPTITLNGTTLTASPANGDLYRWFFNGNQMPGSTNTVNQVGGGIYTVQVVYGTTGYQCFAASAPFNLCTNTVSITNVSGPPAEECESSSFGSITASTSGAFNRTFQWFKNGQPIAGSTNFFISYPLNPSSNGDYRLRVASNCDTAFSQPIPVNVVPTPAQPQITAVGNVLTSSVSGDSYQWYLDGNLISGNNQSITASATGNYSAVVYFDYSTVSCNSVFSNSYFYSGSTNNCADSISGNAVITLPPYTGCETSGSASFNCSLTGNGITYQWFKDGVALSGMNNSFYATTLNAINNGVYTVQGYTSCDTVTFGISFVIDLTAAPAQPTLTANGTSLTANQTADEYIWLLDGDTLPETTQSITMVDAGSYQVIIGDNNGTDFCYSTPSAGYLYFINNNCTFNTTYTIGAGYCPDVEFVLDGATLPVTAYITFTGITNPIIQTLDANTDTLPEYCPSTYNIILVDDAGCADTLNFTVTGVGIAQLPSTINIGLYPNPAQQTISISTSETLTGVSVYNVMGQVVISQQGAVKQLNIAELPAGTYYLHATSAQGSARKPFVKY